MVASDTQLVAIAVPTFGRRVYLQRCLRSVANLRVPDSHAIHLILVDNNSDGGARAIFDDLAAGFDFPATYCHVKQQGIPYARNGAIEAALSLRADYIAFLDDDEEASRDWLVELVRALEVYEGDIASGPKARILPDDTPEWMRQSKRLGVKRGTLEGPLRRSVSSCNVLFKIHLVEDWGIRFRPDFNWTGGSDTVFFEEAVRRGARVVWAHKAMVNEWIPQSRARLGWMLGRDFRVGINKVRRARIFDNEAKAWRIVAKAWWEVLGVRLPRLLWKELKRGPFEMFRGVFKRRAVNFLARAARALGMTASLFGYRYYEYKHSVHGE